MSLLVGPSGCGKTTLLSVVAGILECRFRLGVSLRREVSRMSDRSPGRGFDRGTSASSSSNATSSPHAAAENAAIPS
ncbi:MAG: AAA family ATPase [Isosphaeraceae bacterium]